MTVIAFLILFPLLPAALLAVVGDERWRAAIVRVSAAVIAVAAVAAAVTHLHRPQGFAVAGHLVDHAVLVAEGLLAAALIGLCVVRRTRQWWIPLVVALQAGLVMWCELSSPPAVSAALAVDDLALIMALIIGVIGSAICVYALPYMAEHRHHHPDGPDRRRSFFAILFLFLSAMFAIVFCNHLGWMFLAWEVTTLSSFLLIGWMRTDEADRNSFRALGLNALGGLAFALAIVWLCKGAPVPTLAFDELTARRGAEAMLIPAVLIGIAGLTKSAQMPFSSWLLGAMVAPTPVSALLHSSTMVKAGVFVLVKLAPVYAGSAAGYLLALVGGITFLATSLAAVTQSNAKRVLAYSTIANLGLIVMCAGVGTEQAVWAAIMLIVFHAVAKALLFLAVGSIEHRLGSRDIEDMGGLIVRHPALGVAVVVGILGMFLAPFGMLISKWACLEALVHVAGQPPVLAILLAFGSAPTLFFWGKWLGKVLCVTGDPPGAGGTAREEQSVLWLLTGLTVACSAVFPLIAKGAIEPWLAATYRTTPPTFDAGSILLMVGMLAVLIALPLAYWVLGRSHGALSTRYLAGANAGPGPGFTGALATQQATGGNYYLHELISERAVTWIAIAATGATILGMLLAVSR